MELKSIDFPSKFHLISLSTSKQWKQHIKNIICKENTNEWKKKQTENSKIKHINYENVNTCECILLSFKFAIWHFVAM